MQHNGSSKQLGCNLGARLKGSPIGNAFQPLGFPRRGDVLSRCDGSAGTGHGALTRRLCFSRPPPTGPGPGVPRHVPRRRGEMPAQGGGRGPAWRAGTARGQMAPGKCSLGRPGKRRSRRASPGQAAAGAALREVRGLQSTPRLRPNPGAAAPSGGGGATHLSAEELPHQGGGHLLHEEAVHAAVSAHEAAAAAAQNPRSVGASMAALPWRRCHRSRESSAPFPEHAGWEGGRKGRSVFVLASGSGRGARFPVWAPGSGPGSGLPI